MWDQGLGGALTQIDSTGASETSWSTVGVVSDAEIVDGSFYRFSVVAVNAIGNSAKSTSLGIYAATVPAAPSKPILVSQAATAIAISWVELPEAQNGGSPVLDYQIYWDDPTDADGIVLKVSATQPNF